MNRKVELSAGIEAPNIQPLVSLIWILLVISPYSWKLYMNRT